MTKHFYRVSEFLDPGEGAGESFSKDVDFTEGTLPECRKQALEYYHERDQWYLSQTIFKPLAGPDTWEKGKHSRYSLVLSLVEDFDGEELEHWLLGESEEDVKESLETELLVYKDYGFDPPRPLS